MTARDDLLAAWDALDARGAVVRRFDLALAEQWQVAAATAAAHLRLRVLAEGDAAGWWPPGAEAPLPARHARLAAFCRSSPGGGDESADDLEQRERRAA